MEVPPSLTRKLTIPPRIFTLATRKFTLPARKFILPPGWLLVYSLRSYSLFLHRSLPTQATIPTMPPGKRLK
jgi:hypothetical protein